MAFFSSPFDFSLPPIVCVVHLRESTNGKELLRAFRNLLDIRCELASHNQRLKAGTLYVADGHYHLYLDDFGSEIRLFDDDTYDYSKPSIDLFFASCAGSEAKTTCAILLSGANHDGSKGLKRLADAGGLCAICAPDQSEYDTMPRSALTQVPSAQVIAAGDEHNWLYKRIRQHHGLY